MNDRRCFEALDRTMHDVLNELDTVFGRKPILLGGDFRQTLPVKKRGSKNDIIASSISESYLWQYFKVFVLTQNMRLKRSGLDAHQYANVESFSKWLLAIGDGHIGVADFQDPENASWVTIPETTHCIKNSDEAQMDLVRFIYDDDILQKPTAEKLQEKTIVCPKNETVDAINGKVL